MERIVEKCKLEPLFIADADMRFVISPGGYRCAGCDRRFKGMPPQIPNCAGLPSGPISRGGSSGETPRKRGDEWWNANVVTDNLGVPTIWKGPRAMTMHNYPEVEGHLKAFLQDQHPSAEVIEVWMPINRMVRHFTVKDASGSYEYALEDKDIVQSRDIEQLEQILLASKRLLPDSDVRPDN